MSQGSGFTVFNHFGIESVYGVFFCSGAFAGLNSWGRTFQTEAQLQARELFKVYDNLGLVKRAVCCMIPGILENSFNFSTHPYQHLLEASIPSVPRSLELAVPESAQLWDRFRLAAAKWTAPIVSSRTDAYGS